MKMMRLSVLDIVHMQLISFRQSEVPHQSDIPFDAIEIRIAIHAFNPRVGQMPVSRSEHQMQMFVQSVRRAKADARDEIEMRSAPRRVARCVGRAERAVDEDGPTISLPEVM